MDILTLTVFGLFSAILVARLVEITVKRPQTFLELTGDLRKFAEPKAATAPDQAEKDGDVVDLRPRRHVAANEAYEQRLSA